MKEYTNQNTGNSVLIELQNYDVLTECLAKIEALAQLASGNEFQLQSEEIQQNYLIALRDLTAEALKICNNFQQE